jgi:hypothetical protein
MKGNRGNTRIGATRARGQGRPTKTPWRKDILIRERMQVVARCWYGGMTIAETLDSVNAWAVSAIPSHPRFTLSTIKVDRQNISILAYEHKPDRWWEG